MNEVGWSNVFSSILSVPPCTKATAAPTLSGGVPSPWSMSMTWSELSSGTGGDQPTYYEISWYNPNTSAWQVMTDPSIGL
jgi:hypothetical protein